MSERDDIKELIASGKSTFTICVSMLAFTMYLIFQVDVSYSIARYFLVLAAFVFILGSAFEALALSSLNSLVTYDTFYSFIRDVFPKWPLFEKSGAKKMYVFSSLFSNLAIMVGGVPLLVAVSILLVGKL